MGILSFFRWAAPCMAATVLAGCSAPTGTAPAVYPSPRQGETIRVSVWDFQNNPYYQQVIDLYEATTGNTVEVVDIASADYIDQLSIMLTGGEEIDVIMAKDIPSFSAMIDRHQLEPLDRYIEESGMDISGFAGLLDNIRMDGKLYGLPFRNDYYVLFYNKDIFDRLGVPYPNNDMTWDEYEQLAAQLTVGEGDEKIYGSYLHTWRLLVQDWAIQDGSHSLVTDDYSFMRPYYEQALRMQNETRSVPDYSQLKAGNVHYRSMFHGGQVAMLPMGTWLIGDTIAAINAGQCNIRNWGFVRLPHPAGAESGCTVGATTQIGINTKSLHKEAAFAFIQTICGEQGARILAENGVMPAYSSPDVQEAYRTADGFPLGSMDALTYTSIVMETPVHPQSNEIDQILNEEHEKIMTGASTIDEGLAEMGRRIGELVG